MSVGLLVLLAEEPDWQSTNRPVSLMDTGPPPDVRNVFMDEEKCRRRRRRRELEGGGEGHTLYISPRNSE